MESHVLCAHPSHRTICSLVGSLPHHSELSASLSSYSLWLLLIIGLVALSAAETLLANFLAPQKAITVTCYKKSTWGGNFTPPPPYTPKAACISFGMWGRVLGVISLAKFQLDRFRGFGAPGGRKSLFPIDWRYRPYNSVRTNVLHCDYNKIWRQDGGQHMLLAAGDFSNCWVYIGWLPLPSDITMLTPETLITICCFTLICYSLHQILYSTNYWLVIINNSLCCASVSYTLLWWKIDLVGF